MNCLRRGLSDFKVKQLNDRKKWLVSWNEMKQHPMHLHCVQLPASTYWNSYIVGSIGFKYIEWTWRDISSAYLVVFFAHVFCAQPLTVVDIKISTISTISPHMCRWAWTRTRRWTWRSWRRWWGRSVPGPASSQQSSLTAATGSATCPASRWISYPTKLYYYWLTTNIRVVDKRTFAKFHHHR